MKRVLSILLALLCLLTAVSCGESRENDPGETAASTEPSSEGETADPDYMDALPALNYADETVSILAAGQNGAVDELLSEGLNQELINDSVYERNRMVENRLGVKLEVRADGGSDSYYVANTIHNLVMTGTDEYQICTGPSYVTVQYIIKGDYLDLEPLSYLDLGKHYWAQGYNDMASWGDGYQFTASGSIALSLFRYMYVTLYNKDLMKEYQITDPLEAVQNGTWTIEYQTALTEGMYRDLNGDGKSDAGDAFGFVSGNYTSCDCYWISCEATVLEKDENGYIQYNADVDRIYETVDDVLSLFYRADSYIFPNSDDQSYSEKIIGAFGEKRAFMVTTMVNKLETSLRDFDGEYAILPTPKLDAMQVKYRTCVQDQVTGFSLPGTCPESKQDMVGAVLECLASESYKTVVDAYYNTALSYRYLNNPESKVMLDLIYDSVSFEIAQIYTTPIGGYLTEMRDIIAGKKNTTVSSYKRIERTMAKGLKNVNTAYEKITG